MSKAEEVSRLPSRFFGNKVFLAGHWRQLEEGRLGESVVEEVLWGVLGWGPEERRGEYCNYLKMVLGFCRKEGYSLEKVSCLVEMASHVLQKSMEQRLLLAGSFQLFKDCLVRHSLFRPPYCVLVYSLEEVKAITRFFENTLFKHYLLYLKTFTNKVDIEINTFQMFQADFMEVQPLAHPVDKNGVPEIREYLVDKAIGLTPQELEEIMKGDSIHQVPMSKRLEWQRLKEERQRNAKLQKGLQVELEALNQRFQSRLEEQDKAFTGRLEARAPPGKKK